MPWERKQRCFDPVNTAFLEGATGCLYTPELSAQPQPAAESTLQRSGSPVAGGDLPWMSGHQAHLTAPGPAGAASHKSCTAPAFRAGTPWLSPAALPESMQQGGKLGLSTQKPLIDNKPSKPGLLSFSPKYHLRHQLQGDPSLPRAPQDPQPAAPGCAAPTSAVLVPSERSLARSS